MGCREDFFCNGSNLCIPVCPSWNLFPSAASTALDVLAILCGIIGFVGAVGVLVVSIFRFKET